MLMTRAIGLSCESIDYLTPPPARILAEPRGLNHLNPLSNMENVQIYRPRLTEDQVNLILDLLWYRDTRLFGPRRDECLLLRKKFIELTKH